MDAREIRFLDRLKEQHAVRAKAGIPRYINERPAESDEEIVEMAEEDEDN